MSIPIVYTSDVAAFLQHEHKHVVEAYANHLLDGVKSETILVRKITVCLTDGFGPYYEVAFVLCVDAAQADAMLLWNRVEQKRETWLETQSEATRKLVVSQFVTAIRWDGVCGGVEEMDDLP